DYAVFGGGDHKTGQARDPARRYRELEQKLKALIPGAKVDHRWSGQVIETNDGLPFMGETAPKQFVATGFSGNGITFGTVAAMMARDLIGGHKNPWQELFSVNRKVVRGGIWDYIKENKDYPYYFIKDRLAAPDAKSLRVVKRGEGKIVWTKGKKLAVFRNAAGKLSIKSAVCPHLGCIVHWNGVEKTWDCPCHGSRFKAMGEVIAGPAESDLAGAS
ncbi:MAG TPA: FAD-dependent oxidoreductase, partial [Chthoniobacteraceae bacterium]|nr:FAD-dependent oxidoreductase [Chthoniobacteraceae bacterium]